MFVNPFVATGILPYPLKSMLEVGYIPEIVQVNVAVAEELFECV